MKTPSIADIPEKFRINFGEDALAFESGSAVLSATAQEALKTLAAEMVGQRHTLLIAGHADAAGKASSNRRLSLERAESVKSFFKMQPGLENVQIKTFGLGETRPLPGLSKFAPENRRVELGLVPPDPQVQGRAE